MEELRIGDIIKQRYMLNKFLGSGSFGEVWLAHDQMTGQDVALKIYLSLDPAGIEEFQQEYANTTDLSSPYLLTPKYFDIHNRRPFLVMKFCENGSSSRFVGQISEEQLWPFIHDVSSGLEVLHSQSDPIVHQDIKPDNILVDSNGRFLITDFGISKRMRATMRRQSKRDVSSGAMPYMAPERFDSVPKLLPSSDIWSLGASIYELATGELPFNGFGGGMLKSGADIPVLDRDWSSELNFVMQSCLEKETSERPTAQQLKDYSEAMLKGVPSVAAWNNANLINKSTSSTKSSDSNKDENIAHPCIDDKGIHNNKRFRITAISIVALVCTAIFIWQLINNKKNLENNPSRIETNGVINNEKIEENSIEIIRPEENIENRALVKKNNASDKLIPIQHEVNHEESANMRGSYNYGYATYNGSMKNGKPDGKGKLTFTSSHTDNLRDYSAAPGDYIEGFFSDGKIDHGTLYKSDGSIVKGIY